MSKKGRYSRSKSSKRIKKYKKSKQSKNSRSRNKSKKSKSKSKSRTKSKSLKRTKSKPNRKIKNQRGGTSNCDNLYIIEPEFNIKSLSESGLNLNAELTAELQNSNLYQDSLELPSANVRVI